MPWLGARQPPLRPSMGFSLEKLGGLMREFWLYSGLWLAYGMPGSLGWSLRGEWPLWTRFSILTPQWMTYLGILLEDSAQQTSTLSFTISTPHMRTLL